MRLHGIVIMSAAILLALSVLAFWPGYLSRPATSVDGYTHVHAVCGTLWLSLLLAQSLLIRAHRRRAHILLGRASLVCAPAFILSSVLLAHYRFSRMDSATFSKEAYTLYLPLSAACLFALAFCLGIVFRGSSPLHGRFMLCTALLLVDPVLGRVLALHVIALPQFWHYQLITFGLESVVVLILQGSLPRDSALRASFGAFAIAYILTLAFWFVLPRTSLWFSFAAWFRGLPLTA